MAIKDFLEDILAATVEGLLAEVEARYNTVAGISFPETIGGISTEKIRNSVNGYRDALGALGAALQRWLDSLRDPCRGVPKMRWNVL